MAVIDPSGQTQSLTFLPNRDFFRFGRGSDPRLTAGKDAGERERTRGRKREKERESFQRGGDRGQVYGFMGLHGSLVPIVIPAYRELRNSMDHLAVTPWEMQPHGSIIRITLFRICFLRQPMTSLYASFRSEIFQREESNA